MVNKNMLATLLPICCQKYNKNSKNNIINTDNTKFPTTCGSGKKYKNCCSKNA